MGGRNTNATPAQSPARYMPFIMRQYKHLTILIFLLTLSTALLSQNTLSGNVKGARVRSTKPINDSSKSMAGCGSLRTITEKSEMALFIINDLLIIPEFNERSRFINPENIAEVFVYQKNDSIAKSYGETAKKWRNKNNIKTKC